MAYEYQNFKNGQVLTADCLNHMEEGIAAAVLSVNGTAPDETGNVDVVSGSVSKDQIATAVEEYFTKNPVPGGSAARVAEVELIAANWVGAASPYSQVVNIPGVTQYSQVDLTPSVEQLAIFYNKSLAFVTENEDGVVTIYAIGQKPENDYTIQVTITEVNV